MELQTIQNRIYEIRGQKVLLDFDLAELYETETKRLKQIVRAFVFLRKYALSHSELTQKLQELEAKYHKQFNDIFEAINYLIQKDKVEINQKERKRIGFKTNNK